MNPTLVIHSHFYQPPRENPWTGNIHREPSATPFHNWNQRIALDCYRPNAFAHIVDDSNRLVAVVNNYSMMSFDAGPTLLSWLERHAPRTYERIREADRSSRGAIAQGYSHMILPLANEQDTRTQVRWGLADFRHRFNRESEGIWLPECAVSNQVLEILAQENMRFTILAPNQSETVDPRKTYRWKGSNGSVDIGFFDGVLSHNVAFGMSGTSSEQLIQTVEEVAGDGDLVLIATDGETFGHHHKFAERGLAYALAVEAPRRGLRVTNLSTYLMEHHPRDEIEIQTSSWSCSHGVARWAEDCGCSTGGLPGENQKWREPLRQALDILRDFGVQVFDTLGAKHLRDPWEARDDFIRVILEPSSRDSFDADHVKGDASTAFTLLQAQYHAMLMYTSCGWFFHDISGIETLLVLRHAARVIELLDSLDVIVPKDKFVETLGKAKSNYRYERDGARIWERHILPSRYEQLDEQPPNLFDDPTRLLLSLVTKAVEESDERSAESALLLMEAARSEGISLYTDPAQEVMHAAQTSDSHAWIARLSDALGVGKPLDLRGD